MSTNKASDLILPSTNLIVDPLTDLTPVTRICTYTNVLIVPNSSPARSVRDFIEHCKANRGKISRSPHF